VSRDRRIVVAGIAFTVLALLALAVFLCRPATVLGVDDDALERSLGGESDYSNCAEIADGRWRCGLSRGSDRTVVTVRTRRFGCWTVVERSRRYEFDVPESGCIDGFDAFVNL
jgi:hypothetical protein